MKNKGVAMTGARFLARAAIFAGLIWISIGTSALARESRNANLVNTDKGLVIGAITSDGRQFLGIPYAAPPVGNLRWHGPVPAARWQQPRDATEFGNNCPQFGTFFGLQSFDEDCLFLNVYTPPVNKGRDDDDRGRPVMVWFHPGAFEFGESDDYDPRKLVSRGVVVVTVNYRLGVLGFLAHPALSAEANGASGNYGLMDQQAALRWVSRNIERFGGDADNVTIFGDSAGGFSVHAHLVSPKSRGLFDRAIVESGAYSLKQSSLAEAEVVGATFANAVGCVNQEVACL